MFAELGIACLSGLFSHTLQVGVWWAANSLRVREGFGEIRFGEAKEFVFVKLASLSFRHRFALPASTPQSGRPVWRMAMISFRL